MTALDDQRHMERLIAERDAEIERLRGLLREVRMPPCVDDPVVWAGVDADWFKRRDAALSETDQPSVLPKWERSQNVIDHVRLDVQVQVHCDNNELGERLAERITSFLNGAADPTDAALTCEHLVCAMSSERLADGKWWWVCEACGKPIRHTVGTANDSTADPTPAAQPPAAHDI